MGFIRFFWSHFVLSYLDILIIYIFHCIFQQLHMILFTGLGDFSVTISLYVFNELTYE